MLMGPFRVSRLHYVTKNFSFICQSSTILQRKSLQTVPQPPCLGTLLPPLCLRCLILFILAAIYSCYFNRMSQSGSPSKVRKVSQRSKIIVKSQALLIKITSNLTQKPPFVPGTNLNSCASSPFTTHSPPYPTSKINTFLPMNSLIQTSPFLFSEWVKKYTLLPSCLFLGYCALSKYAISTAQNENVVYV